jgi:SAM-dependent methyltransferase
MNEGILTAFARESKLPQKRVHEQLRRLSECRMGEDYYYGGAPEIYALLGIESYEAADLFDVRAKYKVDLNQGVDGFGPFDIVTNFGTAEHILNIGNAFRAIHDLTRPGGLSLHVLPAYGNLVHGFYNVNPIVYPALATANGYRIESCYYAGDMGRAQMELAQKPPERIPDLPLFSQMDYAAIDAAFRDAAFRRDQAQLRYPVMDYVFVAFRRLTDAPFVIPSQYMAPTRGILSLLKTARSRAIVLFGAGAMGLEAVGALRGFGVNPSRFMDNARDRWGQTVSSVPIEPPGRPLDRAFVVITSQHHREIAAQLRTYDLLENEDFGTWQGMSSS